MPTIGFLALSMFHFRKTFLELLDFEIHGLSFDKRFERTELENAGETCIEWADI